MFQTEAVQKIEVEVGIKDKEIGSSIVGEIDTQAEINSNNNNHNKSVLNLKIKIPNHQRGQYILSNTKDPDYIPELNYLMFLY